ncbi:MAG: carbamoyltransferase, partial [Variibacter sp.]|nr:carbamoyltransferase [Variibacter sp.]
MSQKPVYVLGINAYDHDVSACLLRDGSLAYAIEKERITRFKHASGFFQEVVDYCLAAEGISLDDVDVVVRNCYVLPVEELELRMLAQDVPEVLDDRERDLALKHPLFLPQSDKVVTLSHHLAHAYSAFAPCPFDDGVVMIVDGVGSYCADLKEPGQLTEGVNPLARESESYYRFSGSRLEPLRKVWLDPVRGFLSDEFYYMPGLGAVYSRASSYIFADWNKCGEVMGLAPYGRPGAFKELLQMQNGELRVPEWGREFDKPFLVEKDGDWEASPKVPHWEDIAWRAQDDAEKVLLERAKWLRETTGARNLVMAGGVALNCVANGRIAREAGFDNVWIQPAAGDNGIAMGCAFYGQIEILKKPRSYVMDNAYTGRAYTGNEIDAATGRKLVRMQATARKSNDIFGEAARLLADGKVLGWFQERSEFGPRALGNRSILADPRSPEMKDKLNKRVKHRQAFRPFAPVVLAERANEIFECDGRESPFMLLAESVRPEWRDRVPAIVHVDGTARVQTIRREQNPRLYRLIEEFAA